MKVGVVPQHGRLELLDMSEPDPGPYDCLVKIDAAAICTGTDSNIIAGTFPWLTATPFVLGHESTGIVLETGPKVRNIRKGQRVTRAAAVFPADRRDGIGSNWGAFAELGMVRDHAAAKADGATVAGTQALTVLADDVDPVSAALSVNQREILSVTHNFKLGPQSRVVVIGSGYNGLLFSLYSKHYGAGRVVMVGSGGREKLSTATFEADAFVDYHAPGAVSRAERALGGKPTDLIDAVGTVASLTLAKQLLGPDTAFGRYGLHEYHAIGPLTDELQKGHRALPMGTDEVGMTDEWYRMWKGGFFDREGIYDATMPLADIVRAFERLAKRQAAKLVLVM